MKKTVNITLLNRVWKFKCSKEEEAELQEAVLYLEHRMEKVLKDQGTVGYENAAILTAVLLSHELLREKAKNRRCQEVKKGLIQLREKLHKQLIHLDTLSSSDGSEP